MHILQLGPYPPPEGGIHRNMLAIREDLLNAGHRCSIIATAKSSKITPESDVYHPRTPAELIKLLVKLKYDVLHLHVGGDLTPRVMSLVLACGIIGRRKNVLTIHSGGFAVSDEAKNAKSATSKGFIFRKFERIICVNSLLADVFKRYGVKENKVRLIYPFIHKSPEIGVEIPNDLKDFAEKHSPFLLTVGLLEDTYDLPMQIDAMEKVLQKFPNAGLMIIGSGALENQLKETIAAKSYANRIFLANDVNHKITLHLINRSDILLRTTKFDGDAISIREALHLETPVIATDNGMRPNGVYLIPKQNEEKLVEAIYEIGEREKPIKLPKPDDRKNIEAVLNLYQEVAKF
jgi:glycosyltransferase involved in cell wall biosynthesis